MSSMNGFMEYFVLAGCAVDTVVVVVEVVVDGVVVDTVVVVVEVDGVVVAVDGVVVDAVDIADDAVDIADDDCGFVGGTVLCLEYPESIQS